MLTRVEEVASLFLNNKLVKSEHKSMEVLWYVHTIGEWEACRNRYYESALPFRYYVRPNTVISIVVLASAC